MNLTILNKLRPTDFTEKILWNESTYPISFLLVRKKKEFMALGLKINFY